MAQAIADRAQLLDTPIQGVRLGTQSFAVDVGFAFVAKHVAYLGQREPGCLSQGDQRQA